MPLVVCAGSLHRSSILCARHYGSAQFGPPMVRTRGLFNNADRRRGPRARAARRKYAKYICGTGMSTKCRGRDRWWTVTNSHATGTCVLSPIGACDAAADLRPRLVSALPSGAVAGRTGPAGHSPEAAKRLVQYRIIGGFSDFAAPVRMMGTDSGSILRPRDGGFRANGPDHRPLSRVQAGIR